MSPNPSVARTTPPTAEELVTNPKILLHRKPGPRPANAYLAWSAAVVEDGKFFVTTLYPQLPLFQPVLSVDGMKQRLDFRYAEHDFLQWPQQWCPMFCHLPCIPTKPPGDHKYAIMWWMPDEGSFVKETTGIVTGLGKLKGIRHREFRTAVTDLQEDCNSFVTVHKNTSELDLAYKYTRLLSERLLRLETLSTSYRQMRVAVVSLQRTFLELLALLGYCRTYKPRMDGRENAASSPLPLVGAFVWDLDVAGQLYRAGIPFWYIHHVRDLPGVEIKTLGPLRSFDDLERKDCVFSPRIIHTGSPDFSAQYAAIAEDTSGVFRRHNPFQSVPRPHLDVASSSRLVIRTIPQNRHQSKPYQRPATIHPGGGQNPYSLPTHPLFPLSSPVWKYCLSHLDTSSPPASPTKCFAFPDSQLFTAVQSRKKLSKYIKNWLRFRDILLLRLSQSSCSPVLNHVWRQLLGGEFRSSSGSKETRAANRKLEVRTLLGGCVLESGIKLDYEAPLGSVSWRGEEITADAPVPDRVVQEVLWELSMLNFRCELIALDSILYSPNPNPNPKPTRHPNSAYEPTLSPNALKQLADFDAFLASLPPEPIPPLSLPAPMSCTGVVPDGSVVPEPEVGGTIIPNISFVCQGFAAQLPSHENLISWPCAMSCWTGIVSMLIRNWEIIGSPICLIIWFWKLLNDVWYKHIYNNFSMSLDEQLPYRFLLILLYDS
ncbi:hypothetical protein D9758_013988 [Tetrapyrgos nigripes]|uniref:Uncharacterized protein n=1 Tax=Tetrapyrgos nigripes TaxID=182062 RepID=A0A8H5G830_9AGAR|nr:hypothetical protein D9758_013988 [Tetrapyrgos nigripes]